MVALPLGNLRIDGIINYYKARLVVEGYKQKKMWVFLIHNKQKGLMIPVQGNKVCRLVRLKQVSIQYDMRNLTMRWCQMSLGLIRLVCDVKYITRGYVIVRYAHVCSNNKGYWDDVDH